MSCSVISIPTDLSWVGEDPCRYQFPSPYKTFELVKFLFSIWHGVVEMGILGRSLERVMQRALLLGTNLHAQLLGQ